MAPESILVSSTPVPSLAVALRSFGGCHAYTILKSVEPWLTIVDKWEGRCAQPIRDMRVSQVLNVVVEIEKSEAVKAKAKAKDELESDMTNFKVMEKEMDLPRSTSFGSSWQRKKRGGRPCRRGL
ncbi:hypothetical protein PIB30_048978 [Stylosanthes scabra]|uniref:Uncharacterized protein n=1 Tax=Stylosanthes scabra TaxID=79078 RepID=A0ABU6VJ71_9FABA|nr:hypothetical protein [Stylosanthes scabra]